jgi:hypothetical protein
MTVVEAVAEAVVDVAEMVDVNVDPPGEQEYDVDGGRDRERAPAPVSDDQQPDEHRENEKRPSFFISNAPAKQNVATASAQRSFASSQRPEAATPTQKTSASGRSA